MKLLVEQFRTQVKELFSDSLDKPRGMYFGEKNKKSNEVPKVLRVNSKKKPTSESSNDVVEKMPRLLLMPLCLSPKLTTCRRSVLELWLLCKLRCVPPLLLLI